MPTCKSRVGLTLKELLIAFAIMALLGVLIYPVYRIMRHRALEAQCRANLWAIYLKYKELASQYRFGTYEFRREFTRWVNTPEGRKLIYCPLGGMYTFNERMRLVIYHIETPPEELLRTGRAMDNREMIAYCMCHCLPLKHRCPPRSVEEAYMGLEDKFLAVFDKGDGQVRYASTHELKEWVTSQRELLDLLEYISRQREYENE